MTDADRSTDTKKKPQSYFFCGSVFCVFALKCRLSDIEVPRKCQQPTANSQSHRPSPANSTITSRKGGGFNQIFSLKKTDALFYLKKMEFFFIMSLHANISPSTKSLHNTRKCVFWACTRRGRCNFFLEKQGRIFFF